MEDIPKIAEILLDLTSSIVVAQIAAAPVTIAEVPALIASVHGALSALLPGASAPVVEVEHVPAVPVRSSIKPDYIVCLEDGKKLKMLKRYLRTNFDMSPEEYRAKWNLPLDYPMVAPNYADQRRDLAMRIGLGKKTEAARHG